MIGEYRFFQDFFDGQIVKEESEKFKLFKIMLFSCFSAIGLFLVFIELCNLAEFLLLELGMIWNIYSKLDKKISVVLGVCVALLYFFFTSNFAIHANGLVYVACYIPLQLIAMTKDYSDGDFIQIKKKITDMNKILFFIFFVALFIFFALFDVSVGARFIIFDALSAALLACSALLRNERYLEYYTFRFCALITSIVLWVMVLFEFGSTGVLLILMMYAAYLIFDVVNYFVQHSTYINEYLIQVDKYEQINNQLIIQEKLKAYSEAKKVKEQKED